MKTSYSKSSFYFVRLTYLAFICSFGVLTFSSPALAYIDPGTGSMLIQVFAAAIFGALFTMKTWLGTLKAFFTIKKSTEESPSTTKEEEPK